jgi:hypothetical protein
LPRRLSGALGREVAFSAAPGNGSAGATAEEYWPDLEGLDFRDAVTDFDLPTGTFFDFGVVHLLTTATIDRLRALSAGRSRSVSRSGCGLPSRRPAAS